MKAFLPIVIFLITCSACTKPPILPFDQYNVSSMLNDTVWFATGEAVEQTDLLPKPCISHRFDLFIKTDILYPDIYDQARYAITGCISECRPSQWLTLFNIPVKRGKYRIADLSKCGMPFGNYHYSWVGYSGGLVMPFYLKDSKPGWIRVKHYDPETKVVQGRFKVTFADSTGRLACFERGSFQIMIQQRKRPVSE